MASIKKHGKGYRAQVARQGIRKSKVFKTRQEAKDWAARVEFEALNCEHVIASKTFGDLLERYGREVSVTKRGGHWEAVRIAKFQRDAIAQIQLGSLTPQHFAEWRDRQLTSLAPGSVIREMQLMSSALNTARKEWGWIKANPLNDVRRPPKPAARDRLPTSDEIERIGFVAGADLNNATARAYWAFLFALETAMRAGEICALTSENVDLSRRAARLTHTKNGRPRDVPLSTEAVRLLEDLPELDPVFGLTTRQLDALFRKVRDKGRGRGFDVS